MLIMFTGGRGAGKSTIAWELVQLLQDQGVALETQMTWRESARGRVMKALYIVYLLCFLRQRVCMPFYKRFFRDLIGNRSSGSLSRIYNPCVISRHLTHLKKRRLDVVLYDSDFFSWEADLALEDKHDPTYFQDYYKNIILPQVGKMLLVVCNTDVKVAVERWRQRDNLNLSACEEAAWLKNRDAWKTARKKLVDSIRTVDGICVIDLDGTDAAIDNAKIVFSRMLSSNN